MQARADESALRVLEDAYARHTDPPMGDLLDAVRPDDDDALADLIELDARARLTRGMPVEMERYLSAMPGLESRRVALDAAIEFVIRSSVRGGVQEPDAAAALARRYPRLAPAIRVAVGLNDGIASTTMLVGMVTKRVTMELPCDFGPGLPDGRKRFDVRQRLGGGTQGDVYLAADRALAEPDKPAWVAIKRLNAKSMVDADRAAFAEEARKARRIDHPGVVRVLDRGDDEGGGEYVIYEYVDGGDLAAECARRGAGVGGVGSAWPAREAAGLVAKVCRGVQAAHVAGVVHCDLKPSNILLTREGEPKVADFGVATRVAAVQEDSEKRGPIGNLAFIAPEQFRNEEGSLAIPADIYALGGLLYFLLTGMLPNGDSPEQVAARHAAGSGAAAPSVRAVVPGIDLDLDAICARALAPDPKDRYQSAEALGNDLRTWIGHLPIEWNKPTAMRRAWLFVRREPVLAVAIGAAVALAIGGAGATVYTAMSAKQRQLRERLDSVQKINDEQDRRNEDLRSSLESMVGVLRMSTGGQMSSEWLPPLTILESLMGPVLFDPASSSKSRGVELWTDRVQVAKLHIESERAAGRGASVETAMWLDTLAFWQARSGDVDGAERALADGDAAWGNRLGTNDPWLSVREAVRACAHATRKVAEATAPGTPGTVQSAETVSGLREAEQRLKGALAGLEGIGQRGTVRATVIAQLARLYEPDLLNDPVGMKAMARELTAKPAAAPASAPTPAPKPAMMTGE